MNILLLNLPSVPNSTTDRRQRCTVKSPQNWIHPPIALAYLASVVTEWNKAEIKLIDAVIENQDIQQVINGLNSFKPDLIIAPIGSYSFDWDFKQLKIIKDQLNCPVAVFGEAVTTFAKKFLENYEWVDFCIRGEPELAVSEIVNFLEDKKVIEQVPSIFYRHDGVIKSNERKLVEDLDSIPFPDRSLLKNEKYHCLPFFSGLFTDFNTSRGCPYDCKFCTAKKFWGQGYRLRSPQNILDEIKECIDKFNIKQFFIPDDTFGANKQWLAEIIKGFKALDIKWALQTRVGIFSQETLNDMAEAGCVYIHYGVESGSQNILDYYNKRSTIEQIERAFEYSRRAGIETNATFIIGSPEETHETAKQTIKLARKLKADYYHFSPLIPIPGSAFFDEFKEQGLLKHYDFENYVKPNIIFKGKHLTDSEINKYLAKAYRITVMNPFYVLRRLVKIIKKRDLVEFKILFYGAWWTLKTFLRK